MNELRRPSILEANMIYLVLGFVLLYVGYIVQSREVYSGLLITEYILILLPNLLYLKFKGYSLKHVLRLNKISIKQIIYIFFIILFAYPIAVFLNVIVLTIINSISDVMPTSVPLPTNNWEYLLGLFVIALAPGICEEVMFRGTIMKAYDRIGYKKSIVITAILFGLFHFNIMNLVGPTFLGLILGFLVYKTNSLFSSILAHTINNGLALTIGFGITRYTPQLEELVSSNSASISEPSPIVAVVAFGIIALFSVSILIFLLKNIPGADRSLDMYEFNEFNFKEDNSSSAKYIPLIIIFITFVILNYRLLFFTV